MVQSPLARAGEQRGSRRLAENREKANGKPAHRERRAMRDSREAVRIRGGWGGAARAARFEAPSREPRNRERRAPARRECLRAPRKCERRTPIRREQRPVSQVRGRLRPNEHHKSVRSSRTLVVTGTSRTLIFTCVRTSLDDARSRRHSSSRTIRKASSRLLFAGSRPLNSRPGHSDSAPIREKTQ